MEDGKGVYREGECEGGRGGECEMGRGEWLKG